MTVIDCFFFDGAPAGDANLLSCSHDPFESSVTPDVHNETQTQVLLYTVCISSLYRPYFWNSQSRLSSGHTCRVLSHREMQWKWKACCAG